MLLLMGIRQMTVRQRRSARRMQMLGMRMGKGKGTGKGNLGMQMGKASWERQTHTSSPSSKQSMGLKVRSPVRNQCNRTQRY